MRRSPWLVAALLLTATPLLAGCAEPDAPGPAGTHPDGGGADDASGAGAPDREPAGGGAADPALRPTGDAPPTLPPADDAGAATVLEFAYDGQTETYGWVLVDGRAQGAGADETAENATWEIPFNGTPTRLEATLSWAAESPLTENLTFQLLALDNTSWAPVDGYAIAGTNPIEVDWDLTGFDHLPLALHVTSEQWIEEGDGGAVVAATQAFHVDGQLTFHPAPS